MKKINRNILFEILKNRLKSCLFSKLQNKTVCFDIDGTIYDPYNKNFIQPIYEFYKYCVAIGLRIIIITARSDNVFNKKNTIDFFRYYDIRANRWYFMNPSFDNDMFKYKLEMRRYDTNLGNNIIMSVGDNMCDIGIYGGVSVLVREQHTINNKFDFENILYYIF